MPTKHRTTTPKYCLHKPTNQGTVTLNGKRLYLGNYDLPDTREKYHRIIAEWLANDRSLPVPPEEITVIELCNRYWKWCTQAYPPKNGQLSSTCFRTKSVIETVLSLYGSTKADDFSPKCLKVLQLKWADNKLVRKTVNEYSALTRRIFRWGVSEGMVDSGVYNGLMAVEGLRKGHTEALESKSVKPVAEAHIEAVKPYVSEPIWALIQLQLFTGARSGELVNLRAIDINTTEEIWEVTLDEHKTAHLDKPRTILIGPAGQSILRPFMINKAVDAHFFSPKDTMAHLATQKSSHRRPNQKPSPRKTNRTLNDAYTPDSYRRAITRACVKAQIPHWTPHQLRHNAATRIRSRYGLDAAQTVLGHSNAHITQIYAELDKDKAKRVIREIG